jgi:UDP-N-acetyl-D-mannosaminuronic acid dehydrogenase
MIKSNQTISIIGLGYIGLPFLLSLSKSNFNLIGVDNDIKKIKDLKNRNYISEEKEITSFYRKISKKKITYSSKLEKSDVYILCLPTPLNKKKSCDLKILSTVLDKLSVNLKNEDLIIIESTVPIGFTESVIKKIKEKRLELKKLSFAYVCEKAMPGNTLFEMTNNDRIIGCNNKDKHKLRNIYKSFVKGKIYFTDFKTAEATKLIENTFRDFNIGLAHYLKNILEKNNLNYDKVFALSNKHPRVNILKPSIGVGGHCLPVDPYFLDNQKNGLISRIRLINDNETILTVRKLRKKLKSYKNETICFWGLGYKINSLDLRNSPALKIYNSLSGKNYYASEFKGRL